MFQLESVPVGTEVPEHTGNRGILTVLSFLSSRSSLMFELDNYGALYIVTNELSGRPRILISDLAQRKKISYLKLELVGTKSDREGLGAKVPVTAGNWKTPKSRTGNLAISPRVTYRYTSALGTQNKSILLRFCGLRAPGKLCPTLIRMGC
jgi:hypothetical protein